MRNSGRRRPRLIKSSRTLRQASVLSPPMLLIASSTFWPSSRTPMTTSSEMEVALRSSRTPTTAPSRMSRTIGSSTSERLPVGLHLAPDPAHGVLADRAAKQGGERAAHPARVGASEIAARNQRVSDKRAPLIGPQRLALPLRRLAIGGVEPGARDLDLHPAEASQQRP